MYNDVRYVGKTVQPEIRYFQHCNKNRKEEKHRYNWIQNILNQGLKPIMTIIDEVHYNEWSFWEIWYIELFKSWGFKLLNKTKGGDQTEWSPATQFKKGNVPWNKGITHSDETKKILRIRLTGRKVTKETRQKMSESQKKIQKNIDHSKFIEGGKRTRFKKNNKSWNEGKKGYTTKKLGQVISQDTKNKISNTLKGKLNSGPSRKVKQIDMKTNKIISIYPSIAEAKRKTGIKGIANCVAGGSKSSGGYKWL